MLPVLRCRAGVGLVNTVFLIAAENNFVAVLVNHRLSALVSGRARGWEGNFETFICESGIASGPAASRACLRRCGSRAVFTDGHVTADGEASSLDANGAHETQPCLAAICRRGEVQVDILGIEGLSDSGHVVFPADGGGEVDTLATDDG